jgi:hypothetical protein
MFVLDRVGVVEPGGVASSVVIVVQILDDTRLSKRFEHDRRAIPVESV